MTSYGRYEVLGTLGRGGFAVVYRARDTLLGRAVALKALLPHLAVNPDLRRRFTAEAQMVATLRHPNIVACYDIGETDDQPFFTMDLIDGPTLAQVIRDGHRFTLAEVPRILQQLASAIDYLHAAGFVHRDIKPTNIMLDPGGRIVLMDFGIARALDGSQQTATGAFIGTPEAMSPEQVRGLPVGPASDIYALGGLVYQLLAGHAPFTGDTAHVLYAHANETPPPLRDSCPGLPDGVYAAVSAALQKEPSARPESAARFSQLLTAAAPDAPPSEVAPAVHPAAAAPPPPPIDRASLPPVPVLTATAAAPSPRLELPRQRSRGLMLGGLAALVVLGGAVVAGALMRGGGADGQNGARALAPVDAATGESGRRTTPTVGLVSSTPAQTAAGGASPAIAGSPLATPASTALTGATRPAESPPLLRIGDRKVLNASGQAPVPSCAGVQAALRITAIEATSTGLVLEYSRAVPRVADVACALQLAPDAGAAGIYLEILQLSGETATARNIGGDGLARLGYPSAYGASGLNGVWLFDWKDAEGIRAVTYWDKAADGTVIYRLPLLP